MLLKHQDPQISTIFFMIAIIIMLGTTGAGNSVEGCRDERLATFCLGWCGFEVRVNRWGLEMMVKTVGSDRMDNVYFNTSGL